MSIFVNCCLVTTELGSHSVILLCPTHTSKTCLVIKQVLTEWKQQHLRGIEFYSGLKGAWTYVFIVLNLKSTNSLSNFREKNNFYHVGQNSFTLLGQLWCELHNTGVYTNKWLLVDIYRDCEVGR